jgi:hypothetical protein
MLRILASISHKVNGPNGLLTFAAERTRIRELLPLFPVLVEAIVPVSSLFSPEELALWENIEAHLLRFECLVDSLPKETSTETILCVGLMAKSLHRIVDAFQELITGRG